MQELKPNQIGLRNYCEINRLR